MVLRNIEFKAKLRDRVGVIEKAKLIADDDGKILKQRDVFFRNPYGRTKVRYIEGVGAEVIIYNRSNEPGPRLCEYKRTVVENGEEAEKTLGESHKVEVVVEKVRLLFMLDERTRCHIDTVKDLGCFVEIEVILSDEEDLDVGEEVANRYMEALNIPKEDLISVSYADLLMEKYANSEE